MKKFAKITAGIALVAAIATTAGVLAGCNNGGDSSSPKNGTGEAYGLVHGAGYVGYSKIVYDNDNVTALTLSEVCLPTQVKATEEVAEADRVAVTGATSTTYYYKNVSYGSVTLVYDATDGYKVGSETLVKYLENEANCKAYYEAVMNNQIKVSVGGEQNSTLMSKATLSKDENGYWTTKDAQTNENYSRWKLNRDATVNYVKENGTSKLKSLVKGDAVNDPKAGKDVQYWTDGTVSTGATWSDLNPSDKKGKTYYTYAELILKAEAAIK